MKLLEPPQRVAASRPPSETKSGKSASVLVVDDDASLLALIRHFLVRSGFAVEVAANGFAAWRALSNGRHHLLITDYNMPGMTGIELTEKVRDARMSLPVVIISGDLDAHVIDDRPALNLAAVLPKPFSPAELIALVNDTLSTAANDGSGSDHQRIGSNPEPVFEVPRSPRGFTEPNPQPSDL